MARKSKRNKVIQSKIAEQPLQAGWISMKTALVVVAICSIGMGVLTAAQTIPARGVLEGSLYGLLFGGMVWLVFVITQLFYRWLRK